MGFSSARRPNRSNRMDFGMEAVKDLSAVDGAAR